MQQSPDNAQSVPAFSLDGISKSYKSVQALSPISLDVKGGSIGLLGPNGAGKSTLIKIMMRLLEPSSGSVRVLGCDASSEGVSDLVGYMPEHDCLPRSMSAVRFVSYMGQLSGLPGDVSMERTHDILDYVGMGQARYRKIKEFSTGMKQKVKMAQALVHDPQLVFFDEPTNGLDPEGRTEMLDLLRDVASTGKNIVLSSHLLPDVEYVCDDVVILNGGKLLLHDRLSTALGAEKTVARIRGDGDSFERELKARGIEVEMSGADYILSGTGLSLLVFEAAYASGTQIRFLGQHTQSLEDLFLDVVGGKNE